MGGLGLFERNRVPLGFKVGLAMYFQTSNGDLREG